MNKDSKEFKERVYNTCKRWRKTNQISLMYSRAKSRAKKKGIPFTIVKEDIIIPDRCPLLDQPFTNTYANPASDYNFVPSLDRKDNSKGYTKENIWVISFKANRMKNTASLKEVDIFATNWLRERVNQKEDI